MRPPPPAGSGNGNAENSGDKTGSAETSAAEDANSLEARKKVSDGLPARDFEGRTFTVVTQTRMLGDVLVETETGDILLDTVYERNRSLEERFNVIFKATDFFVTEIAPYVEKSVLSGDKAFDLLLGQAVATSALVLKDYMYDWYKIPHVDFSKQWWAKSTVDDLTYKGKAFIVIGDYSLSAIYATYCMFYDKVAAGNHGITNVYNIVNEGKWVIDKLSEITKDIYTDVNGDGTRDVSDYYGFSSDPNSNFDAYLWAFDNPVMKKSADGTPQLVIRTEKINNMVDKIRELAYQNIGSYVDNKYIGSNGYSEGLSQDMFEKGSVMFANGYLEMSVTHFRNVENEYGIIPYPKWDEAQSDYHTMADGYHGVLALPKTTDDPDFVGIITEALCAESWKTVVPIYYDVALKVKGARDQESIYMIDLIMAGRIFDFGYIYDNWQGMSFAFERILRETTENFESYYAANESKVMKHYNNVLEYFEKAE